MTTVAVSLKTTSVMVRTSVGMAAMRSPQYVVSVRLPFWCCLLGQGVCMFPQFALLEVLEFMDVGNTTQ